VVVYVVCRYADVIVHRQLTRTLEEGAATPLLAFNMPDAMVSVCGVMEEEEDDDGGGGGDDDDDDDVDEDDEAAAAAAADDDGGGSLLAPPMWCGVQVAEIASHCNEKKLAAKGAQEQSDR
jgi:exoribonuclease R